MHKWPVLVECPQFHFWHYSPQFCQDRGVELLRDLYKIQYWPHSHLIVQWFPPICQNAKNSAPIVSRLKFSSSHVSFVSLATVLSLGTGPDPLHFRQKPSVFFTKQCTLSNLWEPARQNVTSLVLCSISISEKHFYRICSQIIFPLESRQIFKVMKYEHCTIYSVFRPFLSSRL